MRKNPFPIPLLVLILFIAIVNALAYKFSWYWRIPWFDMPMHFLGGLWVGSVALWLSVSCRASFKKSGNLKIFIISLFSALVVGVLWEVFEFNVDTIISVSGQNDILDTMSDMTFDILGSIVAGVYFIFKKQ